MKYCLLALCLLNCIGPCLFQCNTAFNINNAPVVSLIFKLYSPTLFVSFCIDAFVINSRLLSSQSYALHYVSIDTVFSVGLC